MKDTLSQCVIAAKDIGLDRLYRLVRSAPMFHQADTNVLAAEQEGENLNILQPIGPIPGILGHKNSVSPGRADEADSPLLRDLQHTATRQEDIQPWEVGDISKQGRGYAGFRDIDPAHPRAQQKLLKAPENNSRSNILAGDGFGSTLQHKLLR